MPNRFLTILDRETLHGRSLRMIDVDTGVWFCVDCVADLPADWAHANEHQCGVPAGPFTGPARQGCDVLVASWNRAAHSLIMLAPEMRDALASIRRYARRVADSKSDATRELAASKLAKAHEDYDVLAGQWARLHGLLDSRTAALVAVAVAAQVPDPEMVERYR